MLCVLGSQNSSHFGRGLFVALDKSMAIATKGSRRITIDEVQYRWSVRRKPTYSQALCHGKLTFSVMNETQPGTTLIVVLEGARPDNWLNQPGVAVTPSIVERAIRSALSEGWCSSEKGPPYVLQLQQAYLYVQP